jgi:iron complex outermembrane receptor protein
MSRSAIRRRRNLLNTRSRSGRHGGSHGSSTTARQTLQRSSTVVPVSRTRVNQAVVTAIATSFAGASAHAQMEDIVVTATKREESLQDVPVAITALEEEGLRELRIGTFDDYVNYLPNVVYQGTGPGQNEIFIRGAATSQTIISLSSASGLQPGVALYVDEQPVALQGRNLDVYVTDMQRVEVVTGPQGTVFGASSQAGTVRLITNKPDHDNFQVGFDASVSATTGGDPSNSVEGFVNVPLSDRFAMRIAAYNDIQGGWIDNVQNNPANGGFAGSAVVLDRNDPFDLLGTPADVAATQLTVPRNQEFVQEDFNKASYRGARIGLSYLINDDWDLLLQHTTQTLETEGVWHYDANLSGNSSVNRFNPDRNEDEFGLTTWTVNGRLANLDVVYTGGYLDRQVDAAIDYTGYGNGGLYAVYYQCDYNAAPPSCFSPRRFYQEDTTNERFTHEFRITTPAENRVRAIGGIFFDQLELSTTGAFQLASIQQLDQNGNGIPGTGVLPPQNIDLGNVEGVKQRTGFGPQVNFVNSFTRESQQIALFGEVEFDILPELTASVGARWYEIEDDFKGATSTRNVTERLKAIGTGTLEALQNAPASAGISDPQGFFDAIQSGQLDTTGLDSSGVLTVDDVIWRASIDWQASEQILLFATYAQGFRPPAVNRVGGDTANVPTGVFADFRIPIYARTDELENYEIGFKSDLFDNTVRLNLTGYYTEIADLQTSRYDPTNISFLWFSDNVGDAEIRGLDGEITWVPTDNWTITSSFSFLDSEISRLNGDLQGIAAPVGSRLPYAAEFTGNIRARYDFDLPDFGELAGWQGYITGGVSYTGDSLAGLTMDAYLVEDTTRRVFGRGSGLKIEDTGTSFQGAPTGTELLDASKNRPGEREIAGGRYVQEAYTLVNLAFGAYRDAWSAEFFIDNLTDERAINNVNTQSFTARVVTNRPRTVGFRVSARFE